MTTAVRRRTTSSVERLATEVTIYVFKTDLAWMAIAWWKKGVRGLSFGQSSPQEALAHLRQDKKRGMR